MNLFIGIWLYRVMKLYEIKQELRRRAVQKWTGIKLVCEEKYGENWEEQWDLSKIKKGIAGLNMIVPKGEVILDSPVIVCPVEVLDMGEGDFRWLPGKDTIVIRGEDG